MPDSGLGEGSALISGAAAKKTRIQVQTQESFLSLEPEGFNSLSYPLKQKNPINPCM